MAAPAANMKVDGDRLWDSLMEMAKIGPGIAGGNSGQQEEAGTKHCAGRNRIDVEQRQILFELIVARHDHAPFKIWRFAHAIYAAK